MTGPKHPAGRRASSIPAEPAAASRDSGNWLQRVGVLSQLPPVLRGLGVDCDEVLAVAGLPVNALDRPDEWVPFPFALRALEAAADRAGCPHLGLLVGKRFRFEQIGLLGELMLNSSSVGDALRSYVVHQRLYSQGFTPFLHKYRRTAEYGFVIYHPASVGLAVVHDLLLAAIVSALRHLCGAEWTPLEVHLPRSAPDDVEPYRSHFRSTLLFDSDHSSVVFRTEDLARAIAGADAVRFRALEREASDKLDANLLPLLYRSLRVLLMSGEPKAGTLAQEFGMHERTLARRLRALGTSFRAVLGEVRYDAGRSLLLDTKLTIADIAYSLGYSEVAAFTTAFKRWAGMTPSEWRAVNRRMAAR
jgi:AraC-like DNA-binding protein